MALDLGALALCIFAAALAWRKVHDLEWPCENDLFRDLGAAQSLFDGGFGRDPIYLGEHWWYQPLVPAIVGLASRVTGTPLHQGYTTLGVYLNLLAPLGFYALAASLFERRAALAALVGFLFLGPLDTPSWLSATYSPWLWSQNLAQASFYLALLAWLAALRRASLRLGAVAGLGLGLTALAHAAPALLMTAIVIASAATEAVAHRREGADTKRVLALVGIAGAVSAVVSAPFWLSVVVHYRAHVRNPVPLEWIAGELRWQVWRDEFWHLPSFRGALALAGFVLLFVARAVTPHARTALVTWGGVAVAGIAYGYAKQRFSLPALLPSWHFYFYLRALESLLFGLAVALGIRAAAWALSKAQKLRTVAPHRVDRICLGVAAAGLLTLTAARFREYRLRADLVQNRRESLRFAKLPSTDLHAWILENTEPNDVFLANGDAAFYAVLPAGRKLVAMGELFSNPYVNAQSRLRDAGALYQALDTKRWNAFLEIARKYHVRYVTLPARDRVLYRRSSAPILRRIYSAPRSSGFDVYEVLARRRG